MSNRDPLLDQLYLRLSNIVDSFNEDIQEENTRLKDQIIEISLERDALKQEKEHLKKELEENSNSSHGRKASIEAIRPYDMGSDVCIRSDMRKIYNFIQANQKIKAIKLLRAITGWGLKDSKDFLDIVLIPLSKFHG